MKENTIDKLIFQCKAGPGVYTGLTLKARIIGYSRSIRGDRDCQYWIVNKMVNSVAEGLPDFALAKSGRSYLLILHALDDSPPVLLLTIIPSGGWSRFLNELR